MNTIEAERIVQLYHDIVTAVVEWGVENQTSIVINGWDDLRQYCDPNEFLVHLLGEDALADAIARDDMTEFDTITVAIDALLNYDPISFAI